MVAQRLETETTERSQYKSLYSHWTLKTLYHYAIAEDKECVTVYLKQAIKEAKENSLHKETACLYACLIQISLGIEKPSIVKTMICMESPIALVVNTSIELDKFFKDKKRFENYLQGKNSNSCIAKHERLNELKNWLIQIGTAVNERGKYEMAQSFYEMALYLLRPQLSSTILSKPYIMFANFFSAFNYRNAAEKIENKNEESETIDIQAFSELTSLYVSMIDIYKIRGNRKKLKILRRILRTQCTNCKAKLVGKVVSSIMDYKKNILFQIASYCSILGYIQISLGNTADAIVSINEAQNIVKENGFLDNNNYNKYFKFNYILALFKYHLGANDEADELLAYSQQSNTDMLMIRNEAKQKFTRACHYTLASKFEIALQILSQTSTKQDLYRSSASLELCAILEIITLLFRHNVSEAKTRFECLEVSIAEDKELKKEFFRYREILKILLFFTEVLNYGKEGQIEISKQITEFIHAIMSSIQEDCVFVLDGILLYFLSDISLSLIEYNLIPSYNKDFIILKSLLPKLLKKGNKFLAVHKDYEPFNLFNTGRWKVTTGNVKQAKNLFLNCIEQSINLKNDYIKGLALMHLNKEMNKNCLHNFQLNKIKSLREDLKEDIDVDVPLPGSIIWQKQDSQGIYLPTFSRVSSEYPDETKQEYHSMEDFLSCAI